MRFLIQAIKIGAIVVLAGLILVGARAAYDYAKQSSAQPTGQPVNILVSKNESVADIGKDLKAKGIDLERQYFPRLCLRQSEGQKLPGGDVHRPEGDVALGNYRAHLRHGGGAHRAE